MDLESLRADELPVIFDRFRLTELLGEGGMGRVFGAEMRGEGGFRRRVALKVVLAVAGPRSVKLRRHLLKEARLGGLLTHPNIAQTWDYGETNGVPWIAMERVEGTSLGGLVRGGGPLPVGPALDTICQVLRGLHCAHTCTEAGQPLNLVHRDIKPANVLVRPDGIVKLVDFGVAKATLNDVSSTTEGTTKGTLLYMSPEQVGGEQLDGRSDIFAVGSLLHYLLSGRHLFEADPPVAVLFRIANAAQTLAEGRVLELLDVAAAGLADVGRRLLAADRSERFPTARDAEEAIDRVREGLPHRGSLRAELEARSSGQPSAFPTGGGGRHEAPPPGAEPQLPPTIDTPPPEQHPPQTSVPRALPASPPVEAAASVAQLPAALPGPPSSPRPRSRRLALLLGVAIALAVLVVLATVVGVLVGPRVSELTALLEPEVETPPQTTPTPSPVTEPTTDATSVPIPSPTPSPGAPVAREPAPAEPQPTSTPAFRPTPAPVAAAVPVSLGTLEIRSTPAAVVTVDGASAGMLTPLEVDVSPGRHLVKVHSATAGWSASKHVDVIAGQRVVVRFER